MDGFHRRYWSFDLSSVLRRTLGGVGLDAIDAGVKTRSTPE